MPPSPNLGFGYQSPGGGGSSFYNESFYTGEKGSEKGRDTNTEAISEIQSSMGVQYEKKYDKGDRTGYRTKNERFERGKDKYGKKKKHGQGGAASSQGRNDNLGHEDYESGDETQNFEVGHAGSTSKNLLLDSTVGGPMAGKKPHDRHRDFKRDDRHAEHDSRRDEIMQRLKDVPTFHYEVGPTVGRSDQIWTFNKSYFSKPPALEYEDHIKLEEANELIRQGEAFHVGGGDLGPMQGQELRGGRGLHPVGGLQRLGDREGSQHEPDHGGL